MMNGIPSAWFEDATGRELQSLDPAPLSPSLTDIFKSDGEYSAGEQVLGDYSGHHGLGQVCRHHGFACMRARKRHCLLNNSS